MAETEKQGRRNRDGETGTEKQGRRRRRLRRTRDNTQKRRHGVTETNGEEAGSPPPRRASRGGAGSERSDPSDARAVVRHLDPNARSRHCARPKAGHGGSQASPPLPPCPRASGFGGCAVFSVSSAPPSL